MGPQTCGGEGVQPRANSAIKTGLEPGLASLPMQNGASWGLCRCGRRRPGAQGHSGEPRDRVRVPRQAGELSLLGIRWTQTLVNGSKIPSGLLLPCLCSFPCYLGAHQAVCPVSLLPGRCCLLSDHLPACCFCQQTEVSERRHQTLIGLLSHLLASVETSFQNVSYQAIEDLDIWGLFMDFITHFIPFTITVESWGLPISRTHFQICGGVFCPEEPSMASSSIYAWQTVAG